ncbi:right-handed parallel beta-helix repeat-containing protein [Streptomyces sp. NPDC026665]|uniref:right-handed parallel beta-helix repeat-containing protein n=1 Tax=Streptomyces sp. NPDC026665 TaxID=3154798 RepID=UPI0033CBED54
MTQYTFGGSPAEVLVTPTGDVVPSYPVLIRRAGTGELITALFEEDGTTPIASLTTNAAGSSAPGAIRTFKINDVAEIDYEYLDVHGAPVRWYQASRELAALATAAAANAVQKTGSTLTGKLQWGMAAATDVVDASFVTGDAFDRYRRLDGGEQQWGSGAAAREVRLFRSAAKTMTLTATLVPDALDMSAQRVFHVIGATGNGVADDQAVIQAALDAAHTAGGGLVVIPPGKTYGVSTFLTIYDSTVLWAYGATLKAIGNTGILRNFTSSETFNGYAGHSHITLLGGTYDGNAADGTTGTVTAETDVLNFVHASDITVRDVTVLNTSTAHALEFNAVDGGRAINCQFYGFRDNSSGSVRQFSEAVQIDMAKSGSSSIGTFDNTPAKNIRIQGCKFGPSTRLGNFGRAVGSHTLTSGVVYDNIKVLDCTIDGALQDGIYAYGWSRTLIRGNSIKGTGLSSIRYALPDPATTPISPFAVAIRDNTCEGAASDSGIRVIGAAAYRLPSVSILGNTVKGITGNGIHAEYCAAPNLGKNVLDSPSGTGLYGHYSDGVNMSENTVRNAGSNALNVSGSVGAVVSSNTVDTTSSNFGLFIGQGADGTTNSTDALIVGNHITAAASAGIRLSTNAVRCTAIANKVRKGSGATANGFSLAASATDCTLLHNDLAGNGWNASTALSVSTAAPFTGPGGMQALPGTNLVDGDLTALPALEAALRPSGRHETTSRLRCGTSSTPTSGTLYLVPIWLPKGFVVSNITFISAGTAAVSLTNWWFSLHDSGRKMLARTFDQTTTAWAANTIKTLGVQQTTAGNVTSYTTTYTGLHYVGIMIKATTVCNIVGEGSVADIVASVSPGFGGTDTGQSTPPTVSGSGFTAGAFGAGSGIMAYAYVS